MSSITISDTGQTQPFTIVRVDFQESVLVTEHPVEIGSDVSDNAQVRPSRFVVDAIVSDSPLPGQPSGGSGSAVQWLSNALGKPLELSIDDEGVFSNLFIETGVHARTVIRERRFTLRLKQVRTVSAARGVIVVNRTSNSGASTKVEAGQQATEDTTVESSVLGRTSSNLGKIAEAFGF